MEVAGPLKAARSSKLTLTFETSSWVSPNGEAPISLELSQPGPKGSVVYLKIPECPHH